MTKGKFIVFEGPDRGGKSTQANLLREYLERHNRQVLLTREPGGTSIAEGIRKILLEPGAKISSLSELLLYEAARAQHTEEKIIPALNEGKVIICERYTMSTLAYQGFGRGIDMDTIRQLNRIATGGITPDVTLVFLMSDKYFSQRGEFLFSDRIELEGDSFRNKMRDGYKKLAVSEPGAVLIDADRSVEEIKQTVLQTLKEKGVI